MKGQFEQKPAFLKDNLVCASCKGALVSSGDLLSCGDCKAKVAVKDFKYYFLDNAPLPRDRALSFEKKSWTPLRRANFDFYKEELSRQRDGQCVIDIGTGPGQLQELFPDGSEIIGVDFVPYQKTVDVVCDLNAGLPFKDGCFDLAFASNVLEHLFNPVAVVKDSYKVLKAGGKFVGSVPFLLMEHQAPHDYFRYTQFSLRRMFAEAGFKDIRIVPLGRPDEVLETTMKHFFKSFVDTKEESGILSFGDRVRLKLSSSSAFGVLWACRKLLRKNKARMDFVLGYGIVATK